MFKKFIKRIIEAKNQEEAWKTVFYAEDGIDMAYQHEKISWSEYSLLVELLKKLA